MTRKRRSWSLGGLVNLHSWLCLALALSGGLPAVCTDVVGAEIELVGRFKISGSAEDLSGLAGHFEDGTPQAQLGGFSAIDYDAARQRYLLLPDRGPADGARPYLCRFHELELTVSPSGEGVPSGRLLASHLLKTEQGASFVGLAAAIDRQHPELSLRFDPEGIRVGRDGTIYVSDEYGPHVFAFNQQGILQKRFELPEGFTVKHLSDSRDEEDQQNKWGRQSNRGFEGLAISADGEKLYAILQGPLSQDQVQDAQGDRLGLHARLVEFDLKSGKTRQFVYVLDNPKLGISEILLYSENQILVLVRDGKPARESKSKRIYLADLSGATDISGMKSLPTRSLPLDVQPLKKTLFLDLLDPRFNLLADLPEKIEGLAFGPDLADGRRLLVVCSDNDFNPQAESQFYFFAVGKDSNQSLSQVGYQLPAGPYHTSATRQATGPLPLAPGLSYESFTKIRGEVDLHHGIPARGSEGAFRAVIEIPSGTNAKWEVQKDGQMHWEVREGQPRIVNFLPYPGNYGFIPQSLLPKSEGGDGDPLDILVLSPAVPRGAVLDVQVIGVMKFLDGGEQDDKLLGVVAETPLGAVRSLRELNENYPGAAQIVLNWFQSYKGPGKMEFLGWEEAEVAHELIEKAIRSGRAASTQP